MSRFLTYRPDIDGLRAIAVLPVVFFHAGIETFSGGYVGVDIFFVISGYLITSIILKEIAAGQFSIATFYRRRICRIFPALFFVLLVSIFFAGLFYTPQDFNKLGKSLYSVLLFFSNFHFLGTQGYFEREADLQLLLHTWSLSVEEQFYVVFPILLIFLKRYTKTTTNLVICSLTATSFVVAAFWTLTDSNFAFYASPLRFWELMLGSLLALNLPSKTKNKIYAELMAAIGLAMIAFSVFMYTEETRFPGLAALPACLGSLLIIYSGIYKRDFDIKITQ